MLVWNGEKREDDYARRMNALALSEGELGKIRDPTGSASSRMRTQVLANAKSVLKKHGVESFLTLRINAQGPPSSSWRRDAARLRWEARWDGRFALETNTDLPAVEAFWAYHERDVVEKFLQSMKSIVELRPVYVDNETYVKAHVFVYVTSVLLLQLLRERLRKARIPLTAVRALERLDNVMEIVVRRGEKLLRVLPRRSQDQARLLAVASVPAAL